MKAWVCYKKEWPIKHIETTATRQNNQWLIGGDFPDYKNAHYIVESKGVEYTLKNGRLVRC